MTFNRVVCVLVIPIAWLVTFIVVRTVEARVLGWEGIAAPRHGC